MGSSNSKLLEKRMHELEDELRKKDEQTHEEQQKYTNELRQKDEQRQQDEQRHKGELRQRDEQARQTQQQLNEHIILLGKIPEKRERLLKKKLGGSETFDRSWHFPNRLNVSLFGEPGIGKTSLVNSFKYAVKGELPYSEREQSAPEDYQGSHTLASLEVALTGHLSVIDNRGITTEMSSDNLVQNEVIRLMEGKYQKGEINWQSPKTERRSYCAVVVFSAHQTEVVQQYRNFIYRLREWLGRFPIAVITHVDNVSSKDVRLALGTIGIVDIYDVANITPTREELSPDHQYSLLQLLERCFTDGDRIFLHRREVENEN